MSLILQAMSFIILWSCPFPQYLSAQHNTAPLLLTTCLVYAWNSLFLSTHPGSIINLNYVTVSCHLYGRSRYVFTTLGYTKVEDVITLSDYSSSLPQEWSTGHKNDTFTLLCVRRESLRLSMMPPLQKTSRETFGLWVAFMHEFTIDTSGLATLTLLTFTFVPIGVRNSNYCCPTHHCIIQSACSLNFLFQWFYKQPQDPCGQLLPPVARPHHLWHFVDHNLPSSTGCAHTYV